jgi:hypothetical protein
MASWQVERMEHAGPACLADLAHLPDACMRTALASLDDETRLELAQAARMFWRLDEPTLASTILQNLDVGTRDRAERTKTWQVRAAGRAHVALIRAALAVCKSHGATRC